MAILWQLLTIRFHRQADFLDQALPEEETQSPMPHMKLLPLNLLIPR